MLRSLNKIFENNGSAVFIIVTFMVTSITIFGGSKYILMMTALDNHTIRNKIEGDFLTNASHLYLEVARFGESREHTAEELEIDRVIRILTIVIELNMVTTALSILTTLGLFCVMSKSMVINKKRVNAMLPYLIWNSIAVLYNVIVLIFISVHLRKWVASLKNIRLCVMVVGVTKFVFIIGVAAYYRYLSRLQFPLPQQCSPALLLRFQHSNGEASGGMDTDDVDEVAIPREMLDGMLTRDRRLSIQKMKPSSKNDSTF